MNRCVIVANGQIDHSDTFLTLLESADCIVCADGALKYLDEINVKPTIILGDFDSVDETLIKRYQDSGIECITFPKRKDATDSELAIDYAIGLNPTEIIMLGMLGKRMDHGLTNLHLLKKIKDHQISASVWDAHNKIYYANSDVIIQGEIGDILSIVPITFEVKGITTYGLDYPLCNETLCYEGSRGVSNVFVQKEIRIETSSGEFFVIIAKD